MSKKKDNTPEETPTSEAEVMEEANGETEPSTQDASVDHPSPEAVEERAAEAEPSHDLDHMQKELAALDDRYLRLVAEFTNYRRRAENELSEAWTRGQADMLRSFVEGLDDLQRVGAWQAESTTVDALIEGVDLVERKFRQALESAGVEMIDPLGEVFDPNIMEAMLGVPTEDPEEDQKVQDVFEKGYSFKGHLVRPARVTVFKHE
jgi:molecular chaperone GrpE